MIVNDVKILSADRKNNFKANLHPKDLKYKQDLVTGIQKRFQFTPTIESLEPILAPLQMKALLRKFLPIHYETGIHSLSEKEPSSIFQNVKNARYRVNLHVHTNKSDGLMTSEEYLEQSRKYSNRAAKTVQDDLPPYTSAITDHNNLEASQEIIAMIADEPKKYKNFKFIPGCEFMFKDETAGLKSPTFEVVGLGINPFSEEILEELNKFNSIKLMDKIKEKEVVLSYSHPLRYCQVNGQTPEFIKYLQRIGVNGIESNYQYIGINHSPEFKKQIAESRNIAQNNNWFETGGTDTHGKNIFHSEAQHLIDELI